MNRIKKHADNNQKSHQSENEVKFESNIKSNERKKNSFKVQTADE